MHKQIHKMHVIYAMIKLNQTPPLQIELPAAKDVLNVHYGRTCMSNGKVQQWDSLSVQQLRTWTWSFS